MAFLAKGKKEDLKILAEELGETVDASLKIAELRTIIEKSKNYKEDFVRELLNTIITTRKEEQAEKERELERERAFQLEKLRIENKVSNVSNSNTSDENNFKFELQKLIPKFDPINDDISIFLTLFERQLKFLKFPEKVWVTHLIGSVPNEIANLIAREPEETAQNYAHVKSMLLKRFKLSPERFRQLFSKHRKSADSTWKDFYFELQSYFNGWISGLDISTFDQLRDLVVVDQIKKRVPPDSREHFLDDWGEIISPEKLVEKLDSYDSVRKDAGKETFGSIPKKKYPAKDKDYVRQDAFKNNPFNAKKENFLDKHKMRPEDHRPPLTCYGCGNPGFIRSKCPKCNNSRKTESKEFNGVNLYTCVSASAHLAMLDVYINGFYGTACTDTGANNSIAGETLFKLLKGQGVKFKPKVLAMTLANGTTLNDEVLYTEVTIRVQGKLVTLELIALPKAKGNRTLLGMDFLQKAGIVLDVTNRQWYFHDMPYRVFNFSDDDQLLPQELPKVFNSCVLREEEGNHLPDDQREELSQLIQEYENVFKPGGEPTPFIEHHIPTGDHAPVAGPPYRMSPMKKELLKKEIEALLEQGIIEECESPYAAPVVLIPKPNGQVRLCIDYRKLNDITTPDTYPLPRLDDLLQDATPTAYMSTIDLKSGYHQVNVHAADRDKTAFVCPFGTFRYVRMPFGLRNAPATFQRLMDKFRYGLCNVKSLTYLDDIIVLSSTFEQHLSDLRLVFERLSKFKLHANREKCHFACSRVKYLGHWITDQGIEVDQQKIESIMNIPSPKNVKQVQSFLQTCSWYRRFIPNFADVSRPLSNLTKKRIQWKWGIEEETAFTTLKQCLVTAPILQQADMTKPFIIRTDASAYALGAVLLQGEGSEEHPVEYASRLLNSAEQNYSTTEREALAVVWALNKFRGYIEGSEITISSDHQPLRWLMSLKSPSGRLARWALQIQSYNLKINYIPGKSNVIADMLSRPDTCKMNNVIVDFPTESSKDLREDQLQDPELKKIVECFESSPPATDIVNWTERGYLMNQGILYRYAPDSEVEEAQLVVPSHDRERILKEYHDAPTAGHYGAEGTYRRIVKRYYWTGMRKFITEYVKACPDCNRYKASNQKPAGLLQTPIYAQRLETLSIDLFGPLPESKTGKRWIFIVEDCATRWVELFALTQATAKECALTLLNEIFLRYGLPRRLLSDNGPQFVSDVMQQLCHLLDIKQGLIPVYHPQANPVERKNRDLKPRLAILVGDDHGSWEERLPAVRFAMNSAKCETTGQTAAYLQFGREMRTLDDVTHDLRTVISNDNFVPEITPYLKNFAKFSSKVHELVEEKQDKRKFYADKKRRPGPNYSLGDKVWVTLHPLSSSKQKRSAKFMPRRDGPYTILTQRSLTTYEVAHPNDPNVSVGAYHTSALSPYRGVDELPVQPLRKRGRPPKVPGSSSGRLRNQRGRM